MRSLRLLLSPAMPSVRAVMGRESVMAQTACSVTHVKAKVLNEMLFLTKRRGATLVKDMGKLYKISVLLVKDWV